MWRHEWEVLQNHYLEKANRPERVDLRSFERQGIERLPTVHLGPAASAMERRGIHTFLGNINRTVQQTNALIRSIGENISKLKKWLASLKEEQRQQEEQRKLKDKTDPPVVNVLLEYFHERSAERATWSGKSKVDGTFKDFNRIDPLVKYVNAHGIHRVSDLMEQLNVLQGRSKQASDVIHGNERRRKEITKIEHAAAAIVELRPIHDTYMKMNFKALKERYAEKHKDELATSRSAYAFLMKHHGKKLEVTPDEFAQELKQMEQADRAAQADLDSIGSDLTTLQELRYLVSKVTPELVGEKKSVRQALKEMDEQSVLVQQQNVIAQQQAQEEKIEQDQR